MNLYYLKFPNAWNKKDRHLLPKDKFSSTFQTDMSTNLTNAHFEKIVVLKRLNDLYVKTLKQLTQPPRISKN